jgi:hypothetical protein
MRQVWSRGLIMVIKIRKNINVSAVPVPICDPCWEGYCTGCEGGNCACQWTHTGPDWDELRAEKVHDAIHNGNLISCTKEEYPLIRKELHKIAGTYIDDGDDVRGIIALREVNRLDEKHHFSL